jgi:hypothetical protein
MRTAQEITNLYKVWEETGTGVEEAALEMGRQSHEPS